MHQLNSAGLLTVLLLGGYLCLQESMPASDPALSLAMLAEALRNFFVVISSPDALPEFLGMQVSWAEVQSTCTESGVDLLQKHGCQGCHGPSHTGLQAQQPVCNGA